MKKVIKKVFKVIGRMFLVLLILFVILTIIFAFMKKSLRQKNMDIIKADGFVNLVSAGDFDMNVNIFGDGKYKIISMPGSWDATLPIEMKKLSGYLDDDISIVAVTRPGYGVSGETKKDVTTEYIVESTRTALQNAGIQKPYVLMPHSMGGVYATYWQSQYPDEIEAVMIIDGSEAQHFDLEKDALDLDIVKWMRRAGNLGLLTSMINSEYGKVLEMLSDEEKPISSTLLEKTISSRTSVDEMLRFQENLNDVWDTLKSNDIPKMYLSISYAFYTKEQLVDEGFTAKNLRKEYQAEGDSDEEIYANYLETLSEKRKILDAYIEKMGNCQKIELQGQHEIMFDKPDECGKILKDFLEKLDS